MIVPAASTVNVPFSMDAEPPMTVRVTGNPEVAVGLNGIGAWPYTFAASELNVMVCTAFDKSPKRVKG